MGLQTSKKEIVCVFCGRKRTISYVSDDGMDWLGHQRGTPGSWTVDDGCNCDLGKLEKQKTTIKPMCHNCAYLESGYCVNKKQLNSISQLFDVGKSVHVKRPELLCENWVLNRCIFDRLFKGSDHVVGKDFVSVILEKRGLKDEKISKS